MSLNLSPMVDFLSLNVKEEEKCELRAQIEDKRTYLVGENVISDKMVNVVKPFSHD